VAELCAVDLPLWAAEVTAAMDAAATPRAKLEAYVRQQLALAADPRHRAVVAIAPGEVDDAARERIRAAHSALTELVVGVLRDLGAEDPRITATLVQGVVDAAVRRAADPADRIAAAAVRMILDGVGSAFPRQRDAHGGEQPGGSAA
jgi:hypothetical protein